MDPVSQAVLGGAVGYAVAGRTAPRKAIIAGMTLAILPDLDIFIAYDNDLDAMTFHRSWTHSWIVHTLLAPLLAWLIWCFDKTLHYRRWLALVWLAWITHAALDALTVFGTQLFWPLMPPPTSIGSIFIIDPLYTLPLLAGCVWVLWQPQLQRSRQIMLAGIVLSNVYLLWGLSAQYIISQQVKVSLAEQGISSDKILVTPTAFNSVLWRVLVIEDDYYYEGFRSLFERNKPFIADRYARGTELQPLLAEVPSHQQMRWFNDGFYKLEQENNRILATDLRMGLEPYYFFTFELAEMVDDEIIALPPNQVRRPQPRLEAVQWVWQRIFRPSPKLYQLKMLLDTPD